MWRASIAAIFILIALPAAAAGFAHNFGGVTNAGDVFTNAVAADGAGNTVIAGRFRGASLVLGNTSLKAIGSEDAFVVKLDASGNVLWARNFGGSKTVAVALAVAVDGGGNVYLGGTFYSELAPTTLARIGISDAFVVKLDPAGNILWARNFGGAQATATVSGLSVDSSGNVHAVGGFYGGNLTTPALAKTGINDLFVIKLDVAGNVTWAKAFGGGSIGAPKVAVDAAGNVYASGYFGGGNLTTPVLALKGYQDAFLLKLDPNGALAWAQGFGASGTSTTAWAVAVDGSGNVHLGGDVQLYNQPSPMFTRIGMVDAFVIKLDTGGAIGWARNFGGTDAVMRGYSLAVDGSANVYLSGIFTSDLTSPVVAKIGNADAYVLKLDPGGNAQWARNFGGAGATATTMVAVDGGGNVAAAGYFSGANLTTPSLVKFATTDIFAVKLTLSGVDTWSRNDGATLASTAVTLATAIDSLGYSYIAGYFAADHITLGSTTLARIGNQDAFVAKLGSSGDVIWARAFGGPGAGTAAISIAADSAGNIVVAGPFDSADLTTPPLASFGSTPPPNSEHNAFVIKLDAGGGTLWAKAFGGPAAFLASTHLALDSSGNIYVSGNSFGNATTPPLARIGNADLFAMKLDSTGALVWAKNFGGSPSAGVSAGGIAVDPLGNIYLAASFDGDLTTPVLTRIGGRDVLVMKLDQAGNVTWAKNFGGNMPGTFGPVGSQAFGVGIALDGAGRIYVCGHFFGNLTTPLLINSGTTDAFVLALDPTGAVQWARNLSHGAPLTALSTANAIATDGVGGIYVGGNFKGDTFTTLALPRIGLQDAFVLRLNAQGAATWAKNFGGSGATALGFALAVDGAGNVVLGGTFGDADLAKPPLTKIGAGDAYVLTAASNPVRLFNLSTRGQVLSGNDVMISGFIVGGPAAKTVVVNVAGPSLANYGVPNPLQNPTLTLVRSSDSTLIASNDDWQTQPAAQVSAITDSGFQPNDAREPAIIATLAPGAYTAIVQGASGGTGVGLVGLFEVDNPDAPLVNLSTRGPVQTGDDLMIAGFIVQGTGPQRMVINVAGPSLAPYGITNALMNPKLRIVRSSDQAVIATNDDWQTQANPADVAAIQATGFQPNNAAEPAVLLTLQPGAYTAIVEGVGGTTGVGLVGVFAAP